MTHGIWAGAGIRLLGFGHYYPKRIVVNPDAVSEEIGVRSRHVADDTESVPEMAAWASDAALRSAGTPPDAVDLLVLANGTTRTNFPEIAPRVAHRIGADRALAFDVCAACAGWVHGVQLAASLLCTVPAVRRAVVVCAEQFAPRARAGSRSALVVGDAAGAIVLGRDADAEDGLLDSVLHTRGADADACVIGPEDGVLRSRRAMVELARKTQHDAVDELLDRNGLTLHDVDWVVPHPGTQVVHTRLRADLAAERGVAPDRVVTNFATAGNTCSATIPTTLSENIVAGRFRPGQLFLTPTAGAGWYSGGLLFRL